MDNTNISCNTTLCVAKSSSAKRCRSNRLIFDRRYGWVFDEWKEPSEEALAGGRGMFCILPLSKALLNSASKTMNLVATTTKKVIEKPDLLSPQVVQASLNDRLQRFISSVREPEFYFSAFNRNLSSHTNAEPSRLHLGNRESTVIE